MKNSEILGVLDLGSSVAENDQNLASYFVPTIALNDFLNDRYDLIRGVKGSGKSAILRIVAAQQSTYSQLDDVILHVATEHTGEPAFKRAFDTLKKGQFSEAQLVAAWKTYLLNLALDALEALPSEPASQRALSYCESIGIRYRTTSTFKKIWWSLLRILHVRNFNIGVDSIQAEFPDAPPDIWTKTDEVIDFPEAHRLCLEGFRAQRKKCWVLIDRLDAAFQDDRELERLALKSLLVAYKDFMGHEHLRLKLFFRTDLFDQVVSGTGFRELTHVLDRTSPPIAWDSDKLLVMIMERFVFNVPIQIKYGLIKADLRDDELRQAAFFSIFTNQIDVGQRKPDTWGWIYNRIRDGNGIRTPRDLQALVLNAARRQPEELAVGGNEQSVELIGASAVKVGLALLSRDKVRTALIAENPELELSIKAFERGKAEHNADSLKDLLGPDWEATVERLQRIGFIEKSGESWKIPMLYRDGLDITQGATFDK